MAVQSLGQLTVDLVANTAGFERGMDQAERALASATKEAKRQGDALDRLIGQIDPTVAAYSRLDKMEQQLAAHRKANRLGEDDFKVYKGQIDAARAALSQADTALSKTGMTAKQTAAALRGVPAQFTDIAVSLQGGQNPLTVFLQQGGQLKDMFGGAGEAARALGGYILGLVSPFTVAAAAAATLALAYKQGSDEATAFNTALTTSGNAAGTTSGELADLAQEVSSAAGTVGKAASVLAQLAGSSRIAVDSFDEIAIAAIKWEEATGKAAAETVKDFEKIAKDPVKAIRELNDSMNFLTTSTYAQIEALQRSGDAAGAANLAEQAYSEALTTRANKIVENLGYVETAWKTVKEFAKDAWDAFLDVGRSETPEERLTRLQAKLEEIRSGGRGGRAQFGLGIGPGGNELAAEKALTDELVAQEESRKRAAAEAKRVAEDRAGIAAVEGLNKSLDDSASRTEKLAKRFAEIDKQVAAAAKRGVQYSEEQVAQLRKAAEAQFKETKGPTFREDAGQRMLDTLRQQHAELQLQASTNEKLGAQAQALARFEQQIADIKAKDIRTEDQKALLASEELLRAQLKRNVALEQEIAARKQATAEAEKLAAFQENQASKLNQAQEGLDSSLSGLGMGSKSRERLQEDLAIRKEYQTEVDRLNKQFNTGQISEDLYTQETAILEENLAARLVMQQDYYNQVDEAQGSFFLGASEAWANWAEEAQNYSAQAAEFVTGTLDTLTDGLADSFMSILDGTKSVGDAFADLGAMMVKSIVGALVQMAAQWLVYQAVQLLVGSTTSAAAVVQAGVTGSAIATAYAPAAALASLASFGANAVPATAALISTTGVAEGIALAGMAHDGIDSVPETGTWLLEKGERVTTASTSAKLDKTLDDVSKGSNGPGGNVTINQIEDRSRAGEVEETEDDQGERVINLFVADLLGDGRSAEAIGRKYGLRSQGQ